MNFNSDFFKNKKDRQDFFIALVVIAAFMTGGVLFSSIPKHWDATGFNQSQLLINMPENLVKTKKVQADEQVIQNLLNHPKTANRLDNWLKSPTKNTKVATIKDTIAVQQDTILTEPESLVDTVITIDIVDSTTFLADTLLNSDTTTVLENVTTPEKVEETPVIPPKETSSKPTVELKNYDCVVIAGAFSVGQNADELKEELLRKGYPAFTFFRKGNKVVGIKQSSADKVTLQKTLKTIQMNYNKNAWILRK